MAVLLSILNQKRSELKLQFLKRGDGSIDLSRSGIDGFSLHITIRMYMVIESDIYQKIVRISHDHENKILLRFKVTYF